MIRPTFMGFESATRGLMTNQKALDIVGNNTTNIGVTGYTRQRVDLVSVSSNTQYSRYSQNTTSLAGQGVNVYGVSQIRDDFLDKRFREEYTDVGYYSATSSILEDLANSMDEIAPATMNVAMENFQNAWDQMLSPNTDEASGASNLLANATQLVQVFQQMSAKIDNVWGQQQYNLELNIENVNSILERVAQLNDAIREQQFNSMGMDNELYQPLELMDQRNVLLDQLAEYADIHYEAADDGQVTVWLGEKDETNPPAVSGDSFRTLSTSVNDSDPQYKTMRVYWADTGVDMASFSGAIRGSLDMLNGRGAEMDGLRGETYTQGILYYKDKIDEFAREVVDSFNRVVEYVYPGTVNEPYDPPRYKAMFSFENDSYENAAGLKISDEWQADSSYIISDIRFKVLENGDRDNTFAANVSDVFKATQDFGEFSGTFYEYISFYSVTKLGNDKAYADSRLEAVTTVADNLLNEIQQVSGVSMEEEGVDLMMYQKAYEAVSRVFTTLDELLDTLINSTGRVGL